MKNALSYYYNIIPNEIHLINNNYFFNIDKYYYVFYQLENNVDVEYIYNLQEKLLRNGIYCHQIIKNKNNEIITIIDEKIYVLMLMYNEMKEKIKMEHIIMFSNDTANIINEKKSLNIWKDLWEKKIDYFEYQISQIGIKFEHIRNSFSYYIGITEMAICLINDLKIFSSLSVSHRRINENSTYFEFYNPFNFIIDFRVRDICEYFKSFLFKKKELFIDIEKFLFNYKLFSDDIESFYIRMLFPSFYFDIYEKIMNNYFNNNIIDETDLEKVETMSYEYEKILKKIYLFIRRQIYFPQIDWFEK